MAYCLVDKLIRHGALVVNFVFYLSYIILSVIAVISGSHTFDRLDDCAHNASANLSAACLCRIEAAQNLSPAAEGALMWFALFGLVFCLFIPLFVELANSVEGLQAISDNIAKTQKWVNLQLPFYFVTNLPQLIYIESHFNSLKQCAIFTAYPHASTFKEMPGIFQKQGNFFSNQLYDFEWNSIREYNFLLLSLLLIISDYYFRRHEGAEIVRAIRQKRRRQVDQRSQAKRIQAELMQDENLFFAEFGNICDIALLISNLTDVQVCTNGALTTAILVFFATAVFQLSFNRKLKESPFFMLYKLLAQEIPFFGIRAWMIMNGVNTSTVSFFLVQKNIAAVVFSLLHLFIKLLVAICGPPSDDEDDAEGPSYTALNNIETNGDDGDEETDQAEDVGSHASSLLSR